MADINVLNRTIFLGDNIDVCWGINSESIDLIYLDPPFNKNKDFIAPIGSKAKGASFKDTFQATDLKKEWLDRIQSDYPKVYGFINGVRLGELKSKDGNWPYLAYMAIRLLEFRRLLKATGSIWLHCDKTMAHYLKVLMDAIFGEKNFKNDVIWCYPPTGRPPRDSLPNKHDNLLYYRKTD